MPKEFRYRCDGCDTVADYQGVHYPDNPASHWAHGWAFISNSDTAGPTTPRIFTHWFCPVCWPKIIAAIKPPAIQA